MSEQEKKNLEETTCCCCEHNHEHDYEHDCCCGHDHHQHGDDCDCGCHDEDHDTIVLTLEDDSEIECAVIGIFPMDDKEYIALVTEEDEQLLVYRYNEVDDENFELGTIDSEEEFEKAMDTFFEIYGEDDIEEIEE